MTNLVGTSEAIVVGNGAVGACASGPVVLDVDFVASPRAGTAPLSVAFIDTTVPPASSWAWAFGDAGTDSTQNPSHTYASGGTYTVGLTAATELGSATRTKIAYVVVANNCVCGITDTFARTVASGWGTSDSTLVWGPQTTGWSTNGSTGNVTGVHGTNGLVFSGMLSLDVRFDVAADTLGGNDAVYFNCDSAGGSSQFWMGLNFNPLSPSLNFVDLNFGAAYLAGAGGSIPGPVPNPYTSLARLSVHLVFNATGAAVTLWPYGTTEPGLPTLSLTPGSPPPYLADGFSVTSDFMDATSNIHVGNLDITDINKCTEYQFDNFNRTVGSGFGTASSGATWTSWFINGGTSSVTAPEGHMNASSASSGSFKGVGQIALGAAPTTFPFTLRTRIRYSTPPASSSGHLFAAFVGVETSDENHWCDVGFLVQAPDGALSGGGTPLNVIRSTTDLNNNIFLTGPDTGYVAVQSNGEFICVVEYQSATTARARAWHDGTAENLTWTDIPVTADLRGGNVYVSMSVGGMTNDLYIDSIEFDYAGKPCY